MRRFIAVLLLSLAGLPVAADEGLWLFNAAPVEKIKARYGHTVTGEWLDHVRESSLRFNNGGSGSFVSRDGLAFTNHHVAADCVSKVGSEGRDLIKTGFHARSRAEEIKCPDLELNVLVGIEDVTDKVLGAARPGMSTAEAGAAQRTVMTALEGECAKSGLRCDVVTLYSGGAYHLYKYRRYMDVRLVFAPEFAIASFGGDPDNFEFPRYGLDVAFFRVYENDRPVQLQHFLRWSTKGVQEGDLVFMSGNPGSTSRLATMAELDFMREVQYPWLLKTREQAIKLMKDFAAKSAENTRISQSRIYSLENAQKSQRGYYAALLDSKLMASKVADEKELRTKLLKADPTLASAWEKIEQATRAHREIYVAHMLIERMMAFDSDLAGYARTLVRATAEREKLNLQRMREYRDSNMPSVEQRLFSTAPVHDALEVLTLTESLGRLPGYFGADSPIAKRVLGGKPEEDVAKALVSGTRLKDPSFRKQLYDGGWAAVSKSDDPMIALMRDVDDEARALRKRYDDEVDAVIRHEAGRIALARFKQGGKDLYPDATFTLRLSYGAVKGYTEDGRGSVVPKGTRIPPYTTIGGAFEREAAKGGKPPYELPPTWKAAKSKLNLKTPMNFVSTADSIGGSSGSPVVNKAGELVGINFDRNMQGLGRNFYFSEEGMRHIAVDSRGILEALRRVYGATALADELEKGSRPSNDCATKNGCR